MSVFGSQGTADAAAEVTAAMAVAKEGEDEEKEDEEKPGTSMMAVDVPRKRKGEAEQRDESDIEVDEEDLSRFEGDDQQLKLKCSREPHSQIEKRRRDKMNGLIDELSAMIPTCQGRKMNKLTVLRKAVQHLKMLRAGPSATFASYESTVLPHEDLRQLLLKAADGFLLIVSCDRAKILFISESVSKILNFSRMELTGKSLFDFLHQKDINKVKEQLATSELYPRNHVVDETGAPMQQESPPKSSVFNTGSRRSFFCRMKHSRVGGTQEDQSLPTYSKRKDMYKYCTLYCTGYMRRWANNQLEHESDGERESPSLSCLVTVCRPLPTTSHKAAKDVRTKPAEFVMRCAIDGKFTFVDQRAMLVIGYLPQEILGTSCYEYFHMGDVRRLAEKHRQVLRSQEKIDIAGYRFKTKYGFYVYLKSQWFSFRNPWTKEIEFIVCLNKVIQRPSYPFDEASVAKAFQGEKDEEKLSPVVTGVCSDVGKTIYAGSIGTQIANEHIETFSSPSSGPSSPFPAGQNKDKGPMLSAPSSKSTASTEEAPGCSAKPQEEPEPVAGPSGAAAESRDEPSPLDLDSVMVPGLSSFTSDEAAIAVIMSLLESDVMVDNAGHLEDMGHMENMEDYPWPY